MRAKEPRVFLPAARVLEVVDDWRARGGSPYGPCSPLTPGMQRLISRMSQSQWTTMDAADGLLIAIGRDDAWHLELADIYERGEHTRIGTVAEQAPQAGYATDEERLEARRATWRRSKSAARSGKSDPPSDCGEWAA